ncbi:unnamed protein product [Closterium sp. Naga37s-1]|nr:unnamed protein product [Closterium sp. Naga37s-1]
MLASSFCQKERNRGAQSTNWASVDRETRREATGEAVTVPPHVLPWLFASAAASLHHACHLGVLSSQTSRKATRAWEYHLCDAPPLRRPSTSPQPPSEHQSAAQRVPAQSGQPTQPQSSSLGRPSSLLADKTAPPSLHSYPLTLVYIADTKLLPPHRPPSTSASAATPSCLLSLLHLLLLHLLALTTCPLYALLSDSRHIITPHPSLILFEAGRHNASGRASRNAAGKASGDLQGVSDASGLADTEAGTDEFYTSEEDVEELNGMLKRRGVAVDARHLDAIVDEYGWTVLQLLLATGIYLWWVPGIPCFYYHSLPRLPLPPSPLLPPIVALPAPPFAPLLPCPVPPGTPLHDAVRQQQWGAVEWLAQQGIDPHKV